MEQDILDEKPILCVKSEAKIFIWTTIFLIVVIPGILLIIGVSIIYVMLLIPFFLINFYLIDQRKFKQFELYNTKLVVKYPWSFIYSPKIYNLDKIKLIKIKTPKGRNEASNLNVEWLEDNKLKKIKHWYSMSYNKIQRLIDEMRKLNIEVEVDDIGNILH